MTQRFPTASRRIVCAASAVLAASSMTYLGGCASDPREGYSFASTFRTDVKSVAVPVFMNNTFSNGIESKLAQSLVAEITRTSPYKVTSTESASTVLEGTITSVEMRPLSVARDTGLVQELSLEIVVDFNWKDNRTGKSLAARRGFSAARTFVPANGVRERIEVGENAAVQQLARDIVAEMRSGW